LTVVVTATNADGHASATSGPTDVVGSTNGPSNTVKPTISGNAAVGAQLTASNGTWSPTPTSYDYQWQQCDSSGAKCTNVSGATGATYGVRSDDSGHTLRVQVTAHVSGEQTTVASNASAVVGGA